jgi:predicted phage gp36 major capsid-like protein
MSFALVKSYLKRLGDFAPAQIAKREEWVALRRESFSAGGQQHLVCTVWLG